MYHRPLAVLLALFFVPPALAQDDSPWGPVPPAPAPTPAPPPPTTWPPPEEEAWGTAPEAPPSADAPTETARQEIREVWSVDGSLARRMLLEDGRLLQESTWAYDALRRPVRMVETQDGAVSVETWTYDAEGRVQAHVIAHDGQEVSREDYQWEDGRLAARSVRTGDQLRTTRYRYDDQGRATVVETRDEAGTLLSRTISDREIPPPPPPPRTPVEIGGEAGLATNSDVGTTDLVLGVSFARKPPRERYADDPLEVVATGSWRVSRVAGVPTNDELRARLGVDWNELVPRLTLFLFTDVERNPVANLGLDLELAPVGAKVDLLDDDEWTLDASLAPVWNWRSIDAGAPMRCEGGRVQAGETCNQSWLRASVRARIGFTRGPVEVRNTLEFLPVLDPEEGGLLAAVEDAAIVRDALGVEIALGGGFSLREDLLFTRDPALRAQADCDAEPDAALCDGTSLHTGTRIAFTGTFR